MVMLNEAVVAEQRQCRKWRDYPDNKRMDYFLDKVLLQTTIENSMCSYFFFLFYFY